MEINYGKMGEVSDNLYHFLERIFYGNNEKDKPKYSKEEGGEQDFYTDFRKSREMIPQISLSQYRKSFEPMYLGKSVASIPYNNK
ncbi:hypothetical protein HOD29_05735 [archaeon]|jgi:hypothetical protein|nr:hypothetical protein [archaeon]